MYCAVHSPTPCNANNRATPPSRFGSNNEGSSSNACATPDSVRPRLFGMPSAARSAAANTCASGNTCVNPGTVESSGAPYCATSFPARRIAATTVICCPSTARKASSKPSHAPGIRNPGRSAINRASNGSFARCACITARSASRSNIRRNLTTISGTTNGSGKSSSTAKAFPASGQIETVP
ncbi:hypothetical protein D3C81_1305620 [compost metagenome]